MFAFRGKGFGYRLIVLVLFIFSGFCGRSISEFVDWRGGFYRLLSFSGFLG